MGGCTAAAEGLYRQRALRRLSEGDALDERVRLTGTRSWVALAAAGLAVAGAVAWGLLASIQTTVGGAGILIRPGGVVPVVTLAPGRLKQVLVDVGSVVGEGQVVARVDQPERDRDLATGRADLEAARQAHGKVAGFETDENRLELEELATLEVNLKERLSHDETQLKWLERGPEVALRAEALTWSRMRRMTVPSVMNAATCRTDALAARTGQTSGSIS